ncbi:MAG: chromate transporter [Clostridiales bacterium]|jgi:chromate transporter|nr:chromate transporter [Clostridiales bacterium]
MIYFKLFLTFLEIGAVSFGGGYGMISLIREKVLINNWMTESELLNVIAVSESTPGPIAVNMATFVGSTQGGFFGSFVATLGVVLPSFIVILVIAVFIRNLMKYKGVNAFLGGIRPCIVGLILATALTMLLGNLVGIKTLSSSVVINLPGIIIFAILIASSLIWKKWKHKAPSPIILILISAVLGMIFYPIL